MRHAVPAVELAMSVVVMVLRLGLLLLLVVVRVPPVLRRVLPLIAPMAAIPTVPYSTTAVPRLRRAALAVLPMLLLLLLLLLRGPARVRGLAGPLLGVPRLLVTPSPPLAMHARLALAVSAVIVGVRLSVTEPPLGGLVFRLPPSVVLRHPSVSAERSACVRVRV